MLHNFPREETKSCAIFDEVRIDFDRMRHCSNAFGSQLRRMSLVD